MKDPLVREDCCGKKRDSNAQIFTTQILKFARAEIAAAAPSRRVNERIRKLREKKKVRYLKHGSVSSSVLYTDGQARISAFDFWRETDFQLKP